MARHASGEYGRYQAGQSRTRQSAGSEEHEAQRYGSYEVQEQQRGHAAHGRARRAGRRLSGDGARRRDGAHDGAERLARALGWFSIGLGLTEVAAPHAVQRAIGLGRSKPLRTLPQISRDDTTTLRLFGLREIGTGLGIFSRRRPAGWMWARVAGDALDLAFLGMQRPRADGRRLAAAAAAVAGVMALDVVAGRRLAGRRALSRSVAPDGSIRVTHTIAINRSPGDCYSFWRNFENLPRVMRHLEAVQTLEGQRSRWKATGPAGTTVAWEAEITEDMPQEMIAWRSLEGGDVDTEGSVHFEPGPKGQGTLVRVALRYRPPAGRLGARIARLMGEEPEQQIREDLRRLKQVLETGEVITTEGQTHGAARGSVVRAISRS